MCDTEMKYEKGKRDLYPFIGMGHEGIQVLAKVRGFESFRMYLSSLGKKKCPISVGIFCV